MLCFSSTFLLACEFKTIRFADAILYLKIICSIHYHYPIKIYQGKSALNINTKMGKVLDKKGFLEHKCKSCGKSFSVPKFEETYPYISRRPQRLQIRIMW